jgi:hypothetical protein
MPVGARPLSDATAAPAKKSSLPVVVGASAVIAVVGGIAGWLAYRRNAKGTRTRPLGDLGKATDLVRAYNDVISEPERYTTADIGRLATRLEVSSAGTGGGRDGLARRAEVLRSMLERRGVGDEEG